MPHAEAPPPLPRAKDRAGAVEAVEAALGLADRPRRRTPTPVGDALLDRSMVVHITAKYDTEGDSRYRYANRLVPTLTDPDEVWLTLYDNGEYRRRYLKLYRDPRNNNRNSMVVVEETSGVRLLYNHLPTANDRYIDRQRVGELEWSRD